MTDAQVREIEDVYRIIYVQNNNISKGIQSVLDTLPETELRNEILSFIQTSDKGVIRGMI